LFVIVTDSRDALTAAPCTAASLLEDAQRGEIVLHVAERSEHRLPVIGDGLVVGGRGLRFLRLAQPAVQQELCEGDPAREG
jgi:hypothetical protein